MIAIIDYNIGNINAVANMLRRLNLRCMITSDASEIVKADRIILPGNGAFDACMRNLRSSGILPALEQRVLNDKVPLLGICVGAQMLGHESEEGTERGLGWVDMRVRRFPTVSGFRVPHMGWSHVTPTHQNNPIVHGMTEETRFYFVHSYFMEPADSSEVLLRAFHGIEFAAGVCRGNITGVQFHPEKSHRFGKLLLAEFGRGD